MFNCNNFLGVEVKVEEVRRLAERREGLEAPVGPDPDQNQVSKF